RRLRAYIGGKGRPKTSSQALFITDIRRPGATSYEGLSQAGIYRTIVDAAARAELGKPVYPHLLRHSALTLMVAAGMHPAMVSDIAGVSVAVIAQHYSHPSDRQRWEAMMGVLGAP
ncbi:MAG: tyrosine-type recombinase/integrase, partial [Trebonia sp.]